ncbi:MAG: glycosyltransferase family 4 protein [Nitrospirae bacterium]|nr:glycosyltransferase family 4 protein [Candidatus Manganitrophaceae bacterium]
MKVLVVAPQPFYQERGTPIAVDLLLKTLSDRGDEVDLLTFHEGSDRSYPGLKIVRIKPWFPVRNIKPGFSLKKLICDAHLFAQFLHLMTIQKYDLVHALEEAAFMALLACPIRKVPYIYDMDSSMTTQLIDKMKPLKKIEGFLRLLEGLPMRSADIVMPMCDALAEEARFRGAKSVIVLKDVSLVGYGTETDTVLHLKKELGADKKIVMYIGNLEFYQGMNLFLESVSLIYKDLPEMSVVIIGGADLDIEKYRHLSKKLGLEQVVHFYGKKPVADIAAYMRQADLLVSPRIQGVNTPMKVYSYLHSKTAVLASDLPTHTQVMTSKIAVLAKAEAPSFSDAMKRIICDDVRREELALEAYHYIEKEHSYEVFKQQVNKAYGLLVPEKKPHGSA